MNSSSPIYVKVVGYSYVVQNACVLQVCRVDLLLPAQRERLIRSLFQQVEQATGSIWRGAVDTGVQIGEITSDLYPFLRRVEDACPGSKVDVLV